MSSRRKLTIDAIPSDDYFPSVQYGANGNQPLVLMAGVSESSRLVWHGAPTGQD